MMKRRLSAGIFCLLGVTACASMGSESSGKTSGVQAAAATAQPSTTSAAAAPPATAPASSDAEGLAELALRHSERLFFAGKIDIAVRLLVTSKEVLAAATAGSELDAPRGRLEVQHGRLLAYRTFSTGDGYDDATAALGRGRDLAKTAGDRRNEAKGEAFLGFTKYVHAVTKGTKAYDAPLEHFRRSLELRHRDGDQRGIAESTFFIGLIHERRDENEEATAHYQRAYQLAESGGFALEGSFAIRHLGFLRRANGDLEGALAALERSLELRESIQFHIYLPYSYLSVGQIHFAKKDYAAALRLYEQALAAARDLDALRAQALCQLSLGEVHEQSRDIARARTHYERARKLAVEIGHQGVIEAATRFLEAHPAPGEN